MFGRMFPPKDGPYIEMLSFLGGRKLGYIVENVPDMSIAARRSEFAMVVSVVSLLMLAKPYSSIRQYPFPS